VAASGFNESLANCIDKVYADQDAVDVVFFVEKNFAALDQDLENYKSCILLYYYHKIAGANNFPENYEKWSAKTLAYLTKAYQLEENDPLVLRLIIAEWRNGLESIKKFSFINGHYFESSAKWGCIRVNHLKYIITQKAEQGEREFQFQQALFFPAKTKLGSGELILNKEAQKLWLKKATAQGHLEAEQELKKLARSVKFR